MSSVIGTDYMPYAPAAPVLGIIRRIRDGRLPEVLNLGALHQLGVAEGNADRVQRSLLFLHLIDEEHKRTEVFNRLGRVSTEEYPAALTAVVREAYAGILQIVNPAEDSNTAIEDAFRAYDPAGQRPRMVSLFLALCREAGIMAGGPVERRPRSRKSAQGSTASNSKAFAAKNSTAQAKSSASDESALSASDSSGSGELADYRLLVHMISQLPKHGRWTKDRRDRWIQAMSANVDLLIEVEEAGAGGPDPGSAR